MATPQSEKAGFDPESYRMTLGEHLEDLRRRMMLGLIGLVIATIGCLALGERVVVYFCKPLTDGLRAAGQNPQLHYSELTEPFMLYLKVSLIVAAAVSGPWILYQFWLFVAAGLYPNERKTITKYIPLSILLLVSGMLLAFYVVMPITVKFLVAFASNYPIPGVTPSALVDVPAAQVMIVPTLGGDPSHPLQGQIWRNAHDGLLKYYADGKLMALPFSTDQLLAQSVSIESYVSLTIMTLLVFGLAFQLPLVVLATYTVGIIDIDTLRRSRKIVYFSLSIIAAVIAPGDVVSAMMALYIPLILLYEMGILLCVWSGRKKERQ
jgi:sec-independent protein translocase protein TatC